MEFPSFVILIRTVAFILLSWLLIHIFAVFGIFLSFAYPLWWLFAPKQITCFFCRSKADREICPLCHKTIDKNKSVSPKNLSSAIFNGMLILIFWVVSAGVVFGESQILFRLGFPPTPKTVWFNIPPKGQYRLGEIFSMPIEIAGVKKPINAVQADLSFDPKRLEAVEVSTKDSFANIFVQKEVNNKVGFTRLIGGLPDPGFFSDRGLLGSVYFKGKIPGIVKVEFLPSSLVLANDGRGTNVLKELASASFLILPDKLSLEEEKKQEVILAPVVLGEQSEGKQSTESTQMIFYEENKVLGTKISQEIEKGRKFDLGRTLLGLLEEVDRFILSFWQSLFFLQTIASVFSLRKTWKLILDFGLNFC